MTTTLEKQATTVAPFGIEINTPRNNDMVIQSIPGCKLRGRIEAARTVKDQKTGEDMVPRDQMIGLGTLPRIPGMELHVSPSKLSYTIIDPLHGNEKMCNTIKKRLEASGVYRTAAGKLDGMPPQKGELDAHRTKTLVREMMRLVNEGYADIVKGALPKLEDIDELPGEYLLNPGSRVDNTQPTYERDWEAWKADLTRHGG